MPIKLEVYAENRLCVSRWFEPVDEAQLAASLDELFTKEGWVPGFHQVIDMRGVDIAGISLAMMRRVAERVEASTMGVPFKTAAVVDNDDTYKRTHMYKALCQEQFSEVVRVFRDGGAAAEWLGCPKELLDRAAL